MYGPAKVSKQPNKTKRSWQVYIYIYIYIYNSIDGKARRNIPGRPLRALKQRQVSSTRTGPFISMAAKRAFSFEISSGSPCNSGTVKSINQILKT
jgi:hypothetical protein